MRKFYFLLPAVVSLLVVGCKKRSEPDDPDLGYAYFPVSTGRSWIYDVDSLWYDNNGSATTIDTFAYQYMESVGAVFTDATGKQSQQLDRYYRQRDTSAWERANSGIIQTDAFTAQKVIENVRYVKLAFPLKANKEWNGNLYNGNEELDYSLEYMDEPFSVNGHSFDLAARVVEQEDLNAIKEIRRYEVYAKNVGLVYFQWDSLDTQSKPNGGTISRGFRIRHKIHSWQP